MTLLCIYHGFCQDGFGAAWAVRHALGDAVEFHAGVYQDAPPDVTDRDVLLVDFSYKRAVLDQLAQVARSITIIDHHKSAQEDLAPFTIELCGGARFSWLDVPGIMEDMRELDRPPIVAHFDMNRSGAGMAWDAFHKVPRPRLIDYIEDRDLWRFRLPHSREIAALVFSFPYDFRTWDWLVARADLALSFQEMINEGAAIERKHHKDVAELVAFSKREMVLGGIRVAAANLPYTLTSDAGHLMATEHPSGIGVCYCDTPKGRMFSLRSTDDGPDVSKLAALYGGGGHAHAAGFRMPLGWDGDSAQTENI